jgi:predicted metal-dependent HD superfamily phosphohydrolase
MTEEWFLLLRSSVLADLDKRLSPLLTYHDRAHTEDVLFHCERIAISEMITDARSLMLLKIAALFHDTGFIDTYQNHEERSCEIMRAEMMTSDLRNNEIQQVEELIMATKMPQSPSGALQRVLCDADLDYLGRDDFKVINKRRKQELLSVGIIKKEEEWHELQLRFLENHRYFTRSSVQMRTPKKLQHLESLRELVQKRAD